MAIENYVLRAIDFQFQERSRISMTNQLCHVSLNIISERDWLSFSSLHVTVQVLADIRLNVFRNEQNMSLLQPRPYESYLNMKNVFSAVYSSAMHQVGVNTNKMIAIDRLTSKN